MSTTTKTKPAARSAKPKPTTPETVAVPDWVNVTPDDTEYSLTMFDQGFQPEQEISLTRDEFLRLKRWLAALRGYDLGNPMTEFTFKNLAGKPESERGLRTIEIAEEEIEMLLDVQYVENVLAANLRQRLKDGAPERVGKWRLSDDGSEIEAHKINGLGINGLDINEVKELEEFAASAGDSSNR